MAERPRTARPLWWGAALGWMALIFWQSSSAVVPSRLAFLDFAGADKLAHLGLYAVLATLLTLASGRPGVAAALALLYGVSDELHQSGVVGRSADVADALADGVGAALGSLAVGFLTHRRHRPPEPLQ